MFHRARPPIQHVNQRQLKEALMTFNGTEQQAKIIELLRSGFPVKRNCQKTTLTTFNSSQALG